MFIILKFNNYVLPHFDDLDYAAQGKILQQLFWAVTGVNEFYIWGNDFS